MHSFDYGSGFISTEQLAASPDGKALLTLDRDATQPQVANLTVLDTSTWEPVANISHPSGIITARWNTDGSLLTIATNSGSIMTWSRSANQLEEPQQLFTASINFLAWNHNSTVLAGASYGSSHPAQIWQVADQKAVYQPLSSFETDRTIALAWSDDDTLLTTLGNDLLPINLFQYQVQVWQVETGILSRTVLENITDIAPVITLSIDNKFITYANNKAQIADLNVDGQVREVPISPVSSVKLIDWAASSNTLLTVSVDDEFENSFVQVWDVLSGQLINTYEYPVWVRATFLSPDGATLIMLSSNSRLVNNALQVVNLGDGQLVRTIYASRNTVVAWHPGGSLFALTTDDAVEVWSIANDQASDTIPLAKASALAWSPDGHMLAIGSTEGIIRIVDVSN